MPKFKCQNKVCKNFGKEERYQKVMYRWNEKLMRFESDYSFCPVCGQYREPVKEYEGFTQAWFKAESNRNYNNKVIKKYDWDRDAVKETNISISKNKK